VYRHELEAELPDDSEELLNFDDKWKRKEEVAPKIVGCTRKQVRREVRKNGRGVENLSSKIEREQYTAKIPKPDRERYLFGKKLRQRDIQAIRTRGTSTSK
jgi:hypothetical protein